MSIIPISIVSLVLGMVLPVFAVTVFAGHAQSSKGYYTVNGQEYENYSYITTGESPSTGKPYANSGTRAQTYPLNPIIEVPAGYLGAKARLFNGNDKLISETEYVYNSKQYHLVNSDFASLNPAVSGTAYYGYGITAAYNGDGYDTYYTFKSPKQNG